MTLLICCRICHQLIVQIEKPEITQADINLYLQSASCDTDGQAYIGVDIDSTDQMP